ncbi:MAG TPA: helix-turn-helix domain-containing protein [Thermoanaerobaculia bacterium]|nr:helix-turn-helix domain-containing protein [Thermoanaerobaculia bacterium]
MIRDRNRIVTLASSMRLAIVHTLEGIGPCSVAALARVLDVAPDSLYYHLRLLERRGLITKNGEIVDVGSKSIELAYEGNRAAVNRVASAVLRAAQRAFHSGFRANVRKSGKRRELWVAQRTARLSREQLATVNRLLNELLDTFEHSRDAASKDPLYLLTFALSPY